MNFVAFGLILICSHVWANEIDDDFLDTLVGDTYARKTKLENFLENFKSSLQNGDSSLGVPVLDPYIAKQLSIKYNQNEPSKINFEGLFTNARVDGLSSYTVNSADFKLLGLKVHMDVSWSMITGNTNYTMKGDVGKYEIYGNGGMSGEAHDFQFLTDIQLQLKGQHVQIKQMSTKISLPKLDFHATGLYDGDDTTSEITSKLISETIPKYIDENQKLVVDNVNHFIMQYANEYLSKISFKELKKMLGL